MCLALCKFDAVRLMVFLRIAYGFFDFLLLKSLMVGTVNDDTVTMVLLIAFMFYKIQSFTHLIALKGFRVFKLVVIVSSLIIFKHL